MNNKKMRRAVLAAVALLILVLAACILPPLPRKARPRALRFAAVNHISSVSMTIPGTNALPASVLEWEARSRQIKNYEHILKGSPIH